MPRAEIPKPPDVVVVKLAQIAGYVEDLLAIDRQADKAPVGMRTLRNNRRRVVEKVLILLADRQVRSYIAEVRAVTPRS